MKKYHLLAPGPTPIPPEVLQAIARPILHHRTPEFEALFGRVRAGLAELIGTRSEVIILAASGTGALEAAVVNLCSPGDEVLVVQCGKFGERWSGIARAFGLTVHTIDAPYGETVPPERVAAALAAHPRGAGALRDPERDVDRRPRGRRGLRRPHPADRHAVRRRHGLVARRRAVPDGRLGHRRRWSRARRRGSCAPRGSRSSP